MKASRQSVYISVSRLLPVSPACTARLRCRPSSAVWPVVCSPPVFWSLLAECQAPGPCQVALLLPPHHPCHSVNQNKLLFNRWATFKKSVNGTMYMQNKVDLNNLFYSLICISWEIQHLFNTLLFQILWQSLPAEQRFY